MNNNDEFEILKRIHNLAETGLVYADEYNIERYEEIKGLSLQLMAEVTDTPLKKLDQFYMPDKKEYPTPHVDIRGFVLNDDDKILLVKEKADGKWSLPGGWADIGYSPSEVAVKEIKEESGIDAKVSRVLAVLDMKHHPHPPTPLYIYKIVFLCTIEGGSLSHSFDILDAGFFGLDELPELSTPRILKEQIEDFFKMAKSNDLNVQFD